MTEKRKTETQVIIMIACQNFWGEKPAAVPGVLEPSPVKNKVAAPNAA
jgi:hypothetical protein